MLRLALTNLLAKRLRSFLAIVGVSVALVGAISLLSFSNGLHQTVDDTLSKVGGFVVMQRNAWDPIVSVLDAGYQQRIEAVPGVRVAVPELWRLAPSVEGTNVVMTGGVFKATVLFGIGVEEVARCPDIGIYPRSVIRGRFLKPGDTKHVVISRQSANLFHKDLGQTLVIKRTPYTIVGVYETGLPLLEGALIVPLPEARRELGIRDDQVSSFYVETRGRGEVPRVLAAVEKACPDADAMQKEEWLKTFLQVLGDINITLVLISSVATVVGVVGVVNTMLMSVMERVTEFGILRANGWSRRDVIHLVLIEATAVGMLAGLLGCGLGYLAVRLAEPHVPIPPVCPPWLLGAAFGLSLLLGLFGGLYPAAKAARLNPMDAIRYG